MVVLEIIRCDITKGPTLKWIPRLFRDFPVGKCYKAHISQADTQRQNDVISTSVRRHRTDVDMTFLCGESGEMYFHGPECIFLF